MLNCSKIKGLIAQSLYETLADEDQQRLDHHLGRCAHCREEAGFLRVFREEVPVQPVHLDMDLYPSIRERLAAPSRVVKRRLAFYGALWATVLLAVVTGLLTFTGSDHVPQEVTALDGAAEIRSGSILAAELDAAKGFAAKHDYSAAYVTLSESVNAHADDALAGKAHSLLAYWSFEELHWYPQALEEYKILQSNYLEMFLADAAHVDRLELLDEMDRKYGSFQPLHTLMAARTKESFEGMEEVVSNYPGTYVATLAAHHMANHIGRNQEQETDEHPRLWAMKQAMEQCTDPIAKTQLQLEVGHIFHHELSDDTAALYLYKQVERSQNAELAQLARNAQSTLRFSASTE